MIAQVVHTEGINWEATAVNAAIIIGGIAVVARFVAQSLRRTITDQIEKVVKSDVTPTLTKIQARLDGHDNRIARLEGIEEGKRQAIAAAGVTTAG